MRRAPLSLIGPSTPEKSDSWRKILLENALDAVIGMDQSGLIIDWNRHAEIIFGWPKELAIGASLSELIIPPAYRQAHENGIAHFLKTGEGPILNRRVESIGLHRNGTEFPLEFMMIPILRQGTYVFYSFVRDITEQRKLAQEVKEVLEARDEFISVISHELRTPITSLKLQASLLRMAMKRKDEALLSDRFNRFVDTTERQIERLTRLIEDMLDISRIDSGQFSISREKLNLGELIKNVVRRFKLQAHARKFVISELIEDDIIGVWDRSRLEQVVEILLDNALKYGDGRPVSLELKRQDAKAVIVIRDEGIGIAKENHARIFEKFERAVNSRKVSGLGLGLYLAKQILDEHGGVIRIESELSRGSTFVMELPILNHLY